MGRRVFSSSRSFLLVAAAGLGQIAGAGVVELYEGSCLVCHGDDGIGVMPGMPDMTDPNGVLSLPREVLFQRVWEGTQGIDGAVSMPPKGGNPSLTESDVKSLIDYMRLEFLGAK